MSDQFSLRELREDAETASDQFVARLITPVQVLALVDAVEAAQRLRTKMNAIEFLDEQVGPWAYEWIALYDALDRFKDYGEPDTPSRFPISDHQDDVTQGNRRGP